MADWISRTEAARRLGVHPNTISVYVSSMVDVGAPGVIRRGRNMMRVDYDKLTKFLEEDRNERRRIKQYAQRY